MKKKKRIKNPTVGVILAGGLGERFWPLTGPAMPKYALKFNGKITFLEETYRRLLPIFGHEHLFISTAEEHVKLVRKILPALPKSKILSEPLRRNTAGATTLSTLVLKKRYGADAVLSFFPADALIQKGGVFRQSVRQSLRLADQDGRIVVLGIRPTRPATGYGYIECGKPLGRSYKGAFCVKRFYEKPNLKNAARFLKSKKFVWNAGIFTWKIRTFEDSMARHAKAFYSKFQRLERRPLTTRRIRQVFKALPNAPIDRLLVEKLKDLRVLKADMGWDDIGSWEALRRMNADGKGNVLLSSCASEDVQNTVLHVPADERLVVAGVRDLIIVRSGKDMLICRLDRAEHVRQLKRLWEKTFRGRR